MTNAATISTTGKLVFHMFAALAQFERNLIRERTLADQGRASPRSQRWPAKEAQPERTEDHAHVAALE
jgi:DNA invertase Pin-like site-specific DNA recombinase